MLHLITAPHLCAGFETEIRQHGPEVVRAAPIIKYIIGWHIYEVEEYCGSKGWKLEHIHDQD